MLCYKDKTYCSKECSNFECQDNKLTICEKQLEAVGLLIATNDFSGSCGKYKEVKK